MNEKAKGSAGVPPAGVWRPAEHIPKRQPPSRRSGALARRGRTGLRLRSEAAAGQAVQNLPAHRPSSVNAKRLGLRRPSAAFLLHGKKAWLAPKNPTPSQSVAVSRTDFAGSSMASCGFPLRGGNDGGQDGRLAQAGGQIACKYFNMNGLQHKPSSARSNPVKPRQGESR